MSRYFTVKTRGKGAYDVTEELRRVAREVGEGLLLAWVEDPLTSLITIEYEANLIADLGELLERLPGGPYVKNALFSKTVAIPVKGGRLALGSFQQVALLDLNEEPGERRVSVMVVR